jgi:hypothetical protein
MSKKLRIYLIAGVCGAAVLGALAGTIYWACQHGPAFYRQALAQDRASAKQGSDALLREAAALASHLRRPGQWHALFTAEQINGWLAYDVRQNHPQLFPPSISEPRVAIENNRTQIAFTWRKAGWSAVVSLETEIYLRQINVVAVRICRARAGILPLPLASLLNDLMAAGQEIGLQIDQEQIEGDPLLVVTLPWADEAGSPHPSEHLSLDSLEVNEGEIYVAGHTQRGQLAGSMARKPGDDQSSTESQLENSNIQR